MKSEIGNYLIRDIYHASNNIIIIHTVYHVQNKKRLCKKPIYNLSRLWEFFYAWL